MKKKNVSDLIINLFTKTASFAVDALIVILTQNASLATSLQ